MKFETAWLDSNFIYNCRLFDPETKKSFHKTIDNKFEFFKPFNKGSYSYILDQSIKMEKFLGSSKDAKGNYGVRTPIDIFIRDNYWRTDYNKTPRIFYLDIETRSVGEFPEPEKALQPITLIQIFDSFLETMFVFGYRDFEMEPDYKLEYKVKYIKCSDEVDLLEKYFKVFKILDPLIIYAWNGDRFDFIYIYNRLKNLGLDSNLMSNYGNCKLNEKMTKTGKVDKFFDAEGHYYIDMLKAYKRFIPFERSSYALDYIANLELGEGKVSHDEFRTFDSFYTGDDYVIADEPYNDRIREQIRQLKIKEKENKEFDKNLLEKYLQFQFVYYGIKDVYLLKKLDLKINLTNILSSMSEKMGCLFSDTMSTLKPWNNYIANICYYKKLALPIKVENDDPNVIGGFVKKPLRGLLEWLLSFDFNSMYPMNMVGFNMSSETYVPLSKCPQDLRALILQYFNDQNEDDRFELDDDIWNKVSTLLKKYNYSLGINGALFDNSKEGIIPELVWEIYTGRKKDKNTMLNYIKQKEIIEDILLKRK